MAILLNITQHNKQYQMKLDLKVLIIKANH